MKVETASATRDLSSIERSVRAAPAHIQAALQRRRKELGLPLLRLEEPRGWTLDEARLRVNKTKALAKRYREALSRADRALARMRLAAKS